MPRMSPVRAQIAKLLGEFTNRIHDLVTSTGHPGHDEVRQRVLAALGVAGGKRRGRPPGSKNRAAAAKPAKAAKPARAAKAKAARKVSPAEARARKLQGQYMGTMRSLSKADVAKVKAERAKSGIEAAIKMAQGLKKAA